MPPVSGCSLPSGSTRFSKLITPNTAHVISVEVLDDRSGAWIKLDQSPRTISCSQAGGVSQLEGTPEVTEGTSGRVKFQVGDNYLILEFLDDDLLHLELSGVETQTDLSQPLHTTPMIEKTDYSGPSHLTFDGRGTFETGDLKVQVEPSTLCLTAWDITRQPALVLTTLCPLNLGQEDQGISLTPESFTHAYGLGESFASPGVQAGDWVGRVRIPGSAFLWW